MPPKQPKGGKNNKKADADEDALLAAMEAEANKAKKELNAKKQAEQQEKAKLQKQQKEAHEAALRAAANLPPLDVAAAAEALIELAKKVPQAAGAPMRDMCWVTYPLHNVLCYAAEVGRKIVVNGEPVSAFEVRDDTHPTDVHSWNVLYTKSGLTYVIDMSLEQFLPAGRHGYKRDAKEEPGWVPVKGVTARITPAHSDAPLPGVVAIDQGIFPAARIEVGAKEGACVAKRGGYEKHAQFMRAALRGNTRNMNKDEQNIAGTLNAKEKSSGMCSRWIDMQEALRAHTFPVTA